MGLADSTVTFAAASKRLVLDVFFHEDGRGGKVGAFEDAGAKLADLSGPRALVSVPSSGIEVLSVGSEDYANAELAAVPGPSGNGLSRKRKLPSPLITAATCPTCDKQVGHLRRHVRALHLPCFWDPTTACWECGINLLTSPKLDNHLVRTTHDGIFTGPDTPLHRVWAELVMGALFFLAHELKVPDLVGLVAKYNDTAFSRPRVTVFETTPDLELRHWFAPDLPTLGLDDLPVPVYQIHGLHWRLIGTLVGLLSTCSRNRFQKFYQHVDSGGYSVVSVDISNKSLEPVFVDTHFHLDKLCLEVGVDTFDQVELRLQGPSGIKVVAAIASYCFPELWPTATAHDAAARSSQLYFAYGLHPTRVRASSISYTDKIRESLSRHNVVAIGEVGLDYHRSSSQLQQEHQRRFLHRVCTIAADVRMPVVVHCRGPQRDSASADCLEVLKATLSASHPVHRLCYMGGGGGLAEAETWIEAFPNVIFGLTPKLLSSQRHPELFNVVGSISSGRIVLESDAPYLPPPGAGAIGHPWQLRVLAEQVAQIKRMPDDLVIAASTRCAQRFYCLPSHT